MRKGYRIWAMGTSADAPIPYTSYMDSSRPASRKLMMSDSEPRAYIRPLVGERPPGPDVLRSLSSQRPHGIDVPRIEPGWPRDGLTNLLISQFRACFGTA